MELSQPDGGQQGTFHLGKYEVMRPLAVGGMAEVFLARQTGMLGFQKPVVIKRILPHLATRADFIEMFLDEARIATQLQHPNIVQTYDVGVANRSYFIAMEYLHGETVRAMMAELARAGRRLPLEHAIHIVSSVAAALHYAHERVDVDGRPLSIVHRDINPQNAIVTFDGTVKLLDFGIAKAQNRFGETRSGTLKGKLPYMSPEQCRGEPLDRRSDVFSLGIMLYELTLARRLFRGVSDFQILKQIVEGEVTPPTTLDPDYDPGLEEVVLRALRKPREERYQTARELLVDLEAFSRAERLHATPIALGDFLSGLFHDKVEAYRRAAAAGKSLTEHLQSLQSAHADDEELSLHIEAHDGTRPAVGPQRGGPDIPVTPPFKLEFTDAGQGTPEAALAAPAVDPAPASRRRWPFLALGALLCLGMGVTIATRWPRPAPPPSSPGPGLSPSLAPTPSPSPTPSLSPSPAPSPAPSPSPAAADKRRHHHRPHRKPDVPSKAVAAVAPLKGEGTLVLAATPWCNVSIDGAARGTTPLTIKLPAGPHTLLLTNPEFHVKRSIPIVVEPEQTLRKRLDFDTQ